MSLRTTLLTILAAVVCLFAAGSWLVQRSVVLPSFLQLEEDLAQRDLARVVGAIGKEVELLDAFTYDWASWDDTYAFVEDLNDAFSQANLSKDYFTTSGNFTAAYFVDLDARIVWGMARDPLADFAPTTIAQLSGSSWPADHAMLANRDITKGTSGLIATEQGPMVIASRPIITSLKQGPMRGWLVLAKQLTPDLMAQLQKQTELEFELLPYASDQLNATEKAARAVLASGARHFIDRHDDTQMGAYAVLPDIAGQPAWLAHVSLTRDVSARGAAAMQFALWSTMAVSLFLLLTLVVLLGRLVVTPLGQLTAHAVALGSSDDLIARLHSHRKDELGVLARQFDAMVDRLAESRSKLLEVARLGGRSEIATSVLHNVGNVLNSVNVSKELLQNKLLGVDERTLDQLLNLLLSHQQDLGEFITNDPAGKHLPRFLKALVESLSQNQRAARTECEQLGEGIAHLRALVAAQQEFAGASGVAEFVAMAKLVGDAIGVTAAKTGGQLPTIDVDIEDGLPLLKVQGHRVLETLINFLCNACESTAAAGRPDPRVTVRVRRNGPQSVRLTVEDNGTGIAPEHMANIFSYGFTTKPGGHGFGLHASANVIREIGGKVSVTSAGRGLGACFTVDVPVEADAPATIRAGSGS